MVETITPVVNGSRVRYLWSIVLHTFGATVAAAAFGALLGAIGALLRAPWGEAGLAAIGLVAGLYLLRDAVGVPIPIPDRHKQVPAWWRNFYSPPVAALLYGFGLGIGFLTFLTFGTFVAVAVAAVASGDPLIGAALCAPFGLARGLSILVGVRWSMEDVDEVAASSWPRALNSVALAAIAAVSVGAALT
jgi:hypothetical protein